MTGLVPEEVQREVEERRDEMLRGAFVVFPELSDEELWQMTTFEANVESHLPAD